MNKSERAAMQDALDALCMPCDRWSAVQNIKIHKAITKLRAALAQPESDYRSPHGHCTNPRCKDLFAAYLDAHDRLQKYEPDKNGSRMVLNAAPPEQAPCPKCDHPAPAKDEFAVRGTLASLKCWHRLTQEESDELVRFFTAKELTCIWTQDADGYYSTQCGEAYVFNDGTPAQNNAYYCHHCGGKLIEAIPK